MSGEPSNPYAAPSDSPGPPQQRRSRDPWVWVRCGLLAQVLALGLNDLLWVAVGIIGRGIDEQAAEREFLGFVLPSLSLTLVLNLLICIGMFVALRGPWQAQARGFMSLGVGLVCAAGILHVAIAGAVLANSMLAKLDSFPLELCVVLLNVLKTIGAGCTVVALELEFGSRKVCKAVLWLGGIVSTPYLILQAVVGVAGLPEKIDTGRVYDLCAMMGIAGAAFAHPGVEWVAGMAMHSVALTSGSFQVGSPWMTVITLTAGLLYLVLHLLYGYLLFTAAAPQPEPESLPSQPSAPASIAS